MDATTSTLLIDYRIEATGQAEARWCLEFDRETLALCNPAPEPAPSWTALGYHQCAVCPLHAAEVPSCPAALHLVGMAERFGGLISYDRVRLEVRTAERRVSEETTAQRALASLLGLLLATGGCPHTRFLRPMARFHLPLASEIETIYRATSTYLLAQYLRRVKGLVADLELAGLGALYANLRRVNLGIAERLRAALRSDAAVNGLVILDMYAIALPQVVDDALGELAGPFAAYLDDAPQSRIGRDRP